MISTEAAVIYGNTSNQIDSITRRTRGRDQITTLTTINFFTPQKANVTRTILTSVKVTPYVSESGSGGGGHTTSSSTDAGDSRSGYSGKDSDRS